MTRLFLVLSLAFVFACPPTEEGDCTIGSPECSNGLTCDSGGTCKTFTCENDTDKSVVPKVTGVAICESGLCRGTSQSCDSDLECLVDLDGETIVAWNRPQGGLGTRISVSLNGFPNEPGLYDSLETIMIQVQKDGAGNDVTDAQLCDTDDRFVFERLPDGQDACQRVIIDQTNSRFPVECRAQNLSVAEEVPVRFLNEWTLQDVDGASIALYSRVVMRDGTSAFGRADVVLEVGDFIQPSWWED